MKYGLNDNAVKRIASVAYHNGDKNISKHMTHISNIYNKLTDPETLSKIESAHTLDAMSHRFSSKDDETIFKTYFAKASAINRGTLNIENPKTEGKKS